MIVKLRPKLEKEKAKIHAGILPSVIGIPEQLEQLFYQLFENSTKFSKPGIPLELSVNCTSAQTIEVGDHLP